MTKHSRDSLIFRLCVAALVFASAQSLARLSASDSPLTLSKRPRQPVALTVIDGGKTLIVANRRSGSVSLIDAAKRCVEAEYDIGRGLSDLVALPDNAHLLVLDQVDDEVVLIGHDGERALKVIKRIKVSRDPIRLALSPDRATCAIASLWSRRLTLLNVAGQAPRSGDFAVSIDGTIDLPFCPRELAFVRKHDKLVVADAFGGLIAVVDVKGRKVDSVRALPGHNIRGLAFAADGQTLVIPHQVLNRLAHTTFDDVHWGLVIRNHLRVLRTDALLKPGDGATLLDGSRLFDLGDVGYAAGDPAAVAFDRRGNLMVALAGVDELAITASPDQGPRRIVVGRRPTALAPSPDGSVVYVADSLADTISIVEIATGLRPATIALGPEREQSAAERGESLFYSAKLSHDGWMSCHSCHSDAHTNNLLSDTLGDGSYGAPKRVPSLLGVACTGPWTWTGSIPRLEDQVKKSIITTMQGQKPSDQQVSELTAFLKSLDPPPPAKSRASELDQSLVSRGRTIFEQHQCARCHATPEYTSTERFDVGLADEVGNREFNPPSLRSVGSRDSFLHDGRARSLEDVFRRERHPRGLVLTNDEIETLVAFLKTL
jgi:cytochrome c peroxidase